jgi:recombination associated protein RdgC
MFKSTTIIGCSPKATFSAIPADQEFMPPLDLEAQRGGWSPVRDDEYVYTNNGQILLHYTIEKKHVPASAVKLVAAAKQAEQAEQQGFPMGKKAKKELIERVRDELLPRALSSRSTTKVWIDPKAGRIVIDSCANSVVESVQRALIKTFGNIGLQDVAWPRAKVMTEWMAERPIGFSLDDQVHLQYPGERGKVVKFANADVTGGDVWTHVKAGAYVQALAMTYDSRISFVMTDSAQLRRIKALDILKETADAAKDVDRFDNDFVLMTGELTRLFNALAAEA